MSNAPARPLRGLVRALRDARARGRSEGTREALQSLQMAESSESSEEPGITGESRRKPLVRSRGLASGPSASSARLTAFARAYAEMFDLSDRFNTETEET